MKTKLSLLALAITLQGCSLAPEYERPDIHADIWGGSTISSDVSSAQSIFLNEFFKDVEMIELIEQSIANNKSFNHVLLNLDRYAAQYRISDSDRYPGITGNAGVTIQDTNITNGRSENYTISVGLTNYELDFFGRLANLKDKAKAEYLSEKESAETLRTSLISMVSSTYIELIAKHQELELEERILENQKKINKLTNDRYSQGVGSKLEVIESEQALNQIASSVASLHKSVMEAKNELRKLVGSDVSGYQIKKFPELASLNSEISSSIIESRPDVKSAEQKIKASNAAIGVAKAAFFPRIALTSNIGFQSTDLANLFEGGSAWAFNPSISIPLLTWGQNRDQLEISEILKEQSIINYKDVVETAFKEVSNALIAKQTYADQEQYQKENLELSHEFYSRSISLYEEGMSSQIDFLSADIKHLRYQQQYIRSKANYLVNEINLFKALGGINGIVQEGVGNG